MSGNTRFDWSGFLVQFFFGALFGAIVGFAVYAKSPHAASPSTTPGCFYIGGGMLVCGLIAGLVGDRFWEGIRHWFL